MELPTRVTFSMPWVSRKAAAACASSVTVSGSMRVTAPAESGQVGH